MALEQKNGPRAAFNLEGGYTDPPDLSVFLKQFPETKLFHVEQLRWWDTMKKKLVRDQEAIVDKLNELSNAAKK